MEKSFQSDNFVGKVSNILLIQKEEKKKTRRKIEKQINKKKWIEL